MKNICCCFWEKKKKREKNKLSSFPLAFLFTRVTIFVVKNSKHMLLPSLIKKKSLQVPKNNKLQTKTFLVLINCLNIRTGTLTKKTAFDTSKTANCLWQKHPAQWTRLLDHRTHVYSIGPNALGSTTGTAPKFKRPDPL